MVTKLFNVNIWFGINCVHELSSVNQIAFEQIEQDVPMSSVGNGVIGRAIVEGKTVMITPIPFNRPLNPCYLHCFFKLVNHCKRNIIIMFGTTDINLTAYIAKTSMG